MKLCEKNICQTFLYVFVWLESNVRLTVFSVHKKTLMQRYNQTLFQRKSNVQLTLEKRNCVTWEAYRYQDLRLIMKITIKKFHPEKVHHMHQCTIIEELLNQSLLYT